ncbi:MAG: dissimilatory sulfite reductase D family protein [Desulfomicrobium sp.]|nr:dissimilatory sulfite reductase D family protein [Pseudomonadota bacterium]MBV1711680.1 dissimilatory sulfite reductase D family protein [Desulfomicrobium sp.]MBU4569744.1 dissimilatory sulfite reductase D family protein [Pseudomonadota bacterium]MBU4595464.1 dissimilatory sulfite reductase D family protein [Pseudomonadota bacterium]MBV1718755.1 dissimilatory sulfite reductase D family protein [Desulfomicrobium sp.]
MADPKDIVIEFIQSKSKQKSKFYFNDLAALFPEMKMRDAKKIINQLVSEGVLEYWSSGSTTMYGIPGTGKQAATEGED